MAGSPYAIVPERRGRAGLSNYTITYVNGSLTVNPAALTITANSTSKTYGQTVTFAGTEFTDERPGQRRHGQGVTQTSTGASRDSDGGRLALCHRAQRGGRYWSGQLHDHLRQRHPDGQPGGADDHGEQHEQDLRPDGDLRRHGVHDSGLVNGDTVTSVTVTSTGAAATARWPVAVSIVPSAAVGRA